MSDYFDFFIDNLENEFDDYHVINLYDTVNDNWAPALPENVTGVITELKFTGQYSTTVLMGESGELVDINTIQNAYNWPTVTVIPNTDNLNISGTFAYAYDGVKIDVIPASRKGIETYYSFAAVPADKYAVVSYEAPLNPAFIVKYTCNTTYLVDGAGPNEDVTEIGYVILVNYETLNQQFLAIL